MRWSQLFRTVVALSVMILGVTMSTSLFGDDGHPVKVPHAPPQVPVVEIKPTSCPMVKELLLARPEFQPGAIERGEADEPGIAELEADWSRGVELHTRFDRVEYRQLQRIRIRCDIVNTTPQKDFWVPPVDFKDRYLRMRVRVFDPNGKLVPMTEFYRIDCVNPHIWVGGGGNSWGGGLTTPFRIDVIPNIVYDMTRPGDYWILIEMQLDGGKDAFYVRAKPIKVKVLPEVWRIVDHGNAVVDPERP